MFDFETSVSGIEFKVRQEEALKNKETIINNLKEENKLIRLGNRLTEGNDSAELKLKINQMIRTIDKSLEIMRSE